MSQLEHSPARIIKELLVDLGLGVEVSTGSSTDWQIGVSHEPDAPDNCITVYDTEGIIDGFSAFGEAFETHGIQIRIRASTHETGFMKGKRIANQLDSQVNNTLVSFGEVTYNVHQLKRTTDVVSLGPEAESRRRLFTINGLASIRIDSVSGTGTS